MLGAGCWVLGAGCWVLRLGAGLGGPVLGAVSGAGCWVLGWVAQCWVLGRVSFSLCRGSLFGIRPEVIGLFDWGPSTGLRRFRMFPALCIACYQLLEQVGVIVGAF